MIINNYSRHSHEIQEHRAPTDESVRLLREMEDKAMDQVTERFRIQGTVLQDIQVWFKGGYMSGGARSSVIDGLDYGLKFKLGEKEFKLEGTIDNRWPTEQEIWEQIFHTVAKHIANEIIQEAFKQLKFG